LTDLGAARSLTVTPVDPHRCICAVAMKPDTDFRIAQIDVQPMDIPLDDEFVISRGRVDHVESAFVRVRLEGGAEGIGEAAPFPALTGETRDETTLAILRLREGLLDQSVLHSRRLAAWMAAAEPDHPAARCGLETALLDALTRALGIPLWTWLGGARPELQPETDITLPILPVTRTLELAEQWYARGFRRIKTKVGLDADADTERVRRIAEALDDVRFVLDANQGFRPDVAIRFFRALLQSGVRIELIEQPVARDDLLGMAAVRKGVDVPLVADESVTSPAEAVDVIRSGAADVINLKIMKSGVFGALQIAAVTRAAGLRLMIGGMMETRLAMGCSLALVVGRGEIDFIDLDTPLLMASDPVRGGFRYDGPRMVPCFKPGLGCELAPEDLRA